ncbi:MAG TPA: hypothetical protein PKO06_12330 [Candidatus Ozemobacteraceae bacterium]|nr:hypothetical protein [Candidatus Ozemobacteraceae bacterium]
MLVTRNSCTIWLPVLILVGLLTVVPGQAQFQTAPAPAPTMDQATGGAPSSCCGQHCSLSCRHGFYTTDGMNVYWFPHGYPRSIHRVQSNTNTGPDLRFATRYRWSHRHYHACACHPVYQMQFKGPYWTHTTYRPARGLLHRSTWRCTWIPYYVAAIPNASVLGTVPHTSNPVP